jgi:hypothetical protein
VAEVGKPPCIDNLRSDHIDCVRQLLLFQQELSRAGRTFYNGESLPHTAGNSRKVTITVREI